MERGDYDWLTADMKILYQNYLPADLKPFLENHSVSGTVLVQAAPSFEETKYLLSLYENYHWIYGVVGWLDLSSPHFSEELDLLMKYEGVVGLRPMLQDIEKSDWILQDQVIDNLKRMVDYHLPLDLLITERHVPYIEILLKKLPAIRVVIDHLAKPEMTEVGFQKWKEDMNKLAKFPNVSCKLSGFMTFVNGWELADFTPYIHHAIQAFGSSRLMFGSDWPVCLSGGSYEQAIQIVTDSLPETLSSTDIEDIFSRNAKSFYSLNERYEKYETGK